MTEIDGVCSAEITQDEMIMQLGWGEIRTEHKLLTGNALE
jgi:hypothetical protein